MTYYLITQEAMNNQTMKIEEGHIYAWPTNGHVYNIGTVPLITIHNSDGSVKQYIGLIDVTKYELKECSKHEAYDACWKHGKFRNKWDVFNGCYREDLKDQSGNPVCILPLQKLVENKSPTKVNYILKYWKENGFDIINV